MIQTSMGIRAGMGLTGSNPTSPMYLLGRECVLVGCFTLHWVTQTGVKGTSQMPTITSLFLPFPHRGTSILRAELQQCQLQHQQWQLALPCSEPAGAAHPGTTGHLPVAKSGTAQGISCLSGCFEGGTATSQPGLFMSLSREGVENQKGQPEQPACL